jgi:hypothetical protein
MENELEILTHEQLGRQRPRAPVQTEFFEQTPPPPKVSEYPTREMLTGQLPKPFFAPTYDRYIPPPSLPPQVQAISRDLDCVQIARHIETCPVCSRIHNKKMHNLMIIVLLILLIYACKRFFE